MNLPVEEYSSELSSGELCTQRDEGLLAGTLVKVPFGYVPIEELQVGDLVISQNELGILETDIVTAIEQTTVHQIVRITVAGISVDVADGHQFFTPLVKSWIQAYQCSYRDELLSFPRRALPIDSVEIIYGTFEVIKLSIENNHNFFVSERALLVHNFLPALPLLAAAAKPLAVAAAKAAVALAVRIVAEKVVKEVTGNDKLAQAVGRAAEGGTRRYAEDHFGGSSASSSNGTAIYSYPQDGSSSVDISFFANNSSNSGNNGKGNDNGSGNNGNNKNNQPLDPKTGNYILFRQRCERADQEFKKVKVDFPTNGSPVYEHPNKPNRLISPDRDGHKGGAWKEFDRKGNRLATLDDNFEPIAG